MDTLLIIKVGAQETFLLEYTEVCCMKNKSWVSELNGSYKFNPITHKLMINV